MKLYTLLFVALLAPSMAFADHRPQKNTATKLYFPVYNTSNGELLSGATLDCETDGYSDGSAGDGFADFSGTETEVGSTGIYYVSATSGEMNFDYVALKCTSSTSNAQDVFKVFDLKHGTVLTDSAGALDTNTIPDKAFSLPQLTAESGTTLTLAASAVAIDDQFNTGFSIDVYDNSTKAVKARSCIVDSTNTGETIVTAEDISAQITGAGGSADYYAIKTDAGCLLQKTGAELTACPSGTATPIQQQQFIYMLARNAANCTTAAGTTTCTIKRDGGSTTLCTFTATDDGSTLSVSEGS